MSFTAPQSSSRRRRKAVNDWSSITITANSAKSRIKYVDSCVKFILDKAKESYETPHVYYTPFRPENAASIMPDSKSNSENFPVGLGLQRRWLPNHDCVSIECSLCQNVVSPSEHNQCGTLKNAYSKPAWSLVCPECFTKL